GHRLWAVSVSGDPGVWKSSARTRATSSGEKRRWPATSRAIGGMRPSCSRALIQAELTPSCFATVPIRTMNHLLHGFPHKTTMIFRYAENEGKAEASYDARTARKSAAAEGPQEGCRRWKVCPPQGPP